MKKIDLTVRCTDPNRRTFPAKYKIAAEWTGGGFTELKTFGFADDECLSAVFRSAEARAEQIRLTDGEVLGEMRVFHLDVRQHDYELSRAMDIESRIRASTH